MILISPLWMTTGATETGMAGDEGGMLRTGAGDGEIFPTGNGGIGLERAGAGGGANLITGGEIDSAARTGAIGRGAMGATRGGDSTGGLAAIVRAGSSFSRRTSSAVLTKASAGTLVVKAAL